MNNSSNMSTADLQNHNNLYGHNNMHPYMAQQQQQQQQHPHHHHQPQYLPQHQQHPMMVMSNMKHDEDDMDFHDNKSETSSRSGGCNSKSKVFQCTGYGECSMVFTRSEHLARHMRKHTGEKPFKCVVPGCERMFSRFDNMMQHTQTHNKTRSGPRRNSNKPVKTKRGGGKKCSGTIRRANSSDDYDEYGPLPSPPPSRRGSSNVITKEHQIILPNPKYLEVDEEDDDDMSDDDQRGGPSAPRQQQHRSHHQQASYKNSNRKGGSRYPDSPASSDSSNHDYFAPIKPIHRRRSAPRIHYQPYPYQYSEQPEVIPVLPRRNSALSQLATYLCNNPDQSPESYLSQQSQQQQQSSTTQHQDDKDEEPPKELSMTRRLSIQDLSNPLNEVSSGSSSMEDDEEEEGVSLTEDEYQAIQGFGQFYRHAASVTSCNK